MYWRTRTTGKASRIKQSPLDKRNLRSEGLNVLFANDKVTKTSGNGYLCGEMKNQKKRGSEGSSWDLKTLIALLRSLPQVQLRVLKDKDREKGVTKGLSRQKRGGRGGRKLAMNICCLSVPSPTGSGSPRIRCTAAATKVSSNTNITALLSQTKLWR